MPPSATAPNSEARCFEGATQSSGVRETGRSVPASSCSARPACAWTLAGRGRASSKVIRYPDLTDVEKAAPADRIRSRPTAVINRGSGTLVSIAAIDGMGSVREIVDRLRASLRKDAVMSRLIVVVPLDEGAKDQGQGAPEPGPAVQYRGNAPGAARCLSQRPRGHLRLRNTWKRAADRLQRRGSGAARGGEGLGRRYGRHSTKGLAGLSRATLDRAGRWRRASTMPAFQPGARPPRGVWIDSTSSPLRTMSQEMTEFEFHISPAWSSSRPQTGVGTCGTSSSIRRASRDRRSSGAGFRPPPRCRGSRLRASSAPRSGRVGGGRPRVPRRRPSARRRAPPVARTSTGAISITKRASGKRTRGRSGRVAALVDRGAPRGPRRRAR